VSKFNGIILSLDLATQLGWAWGRPEDEVPHFGSRRLKGSDRAARYRDFREFLAVMITDKVSRVVFESSVTQLMHGKTNIETVKFLIGITEHLEEFCYQRVELREARVSDVRMHFIKANPKREIAKAKTIGRCRDMGWDVKNDDEADACALWSYQVCTIRPDLAATHSPLFSRVKHQIVGGA